jgi:hypothetical protein
VAFLDCSEESRGERAESAGVKERSEVLFGLGVSDGAICSMSNGTICNMPTRGAGCWVCRRLWEAGLGLFVASTSPDPAVQACVIIFGSKRSSQERGSRTQGSALLKEGS